MSQSVVREEQDPLAELRRHTEELADRLPGRLHRIKLSSGDLVVEAEWAAPAVPVAAVPAAVPAVPVPVAAHPAAGGQAPAAADSSAPAGAIQLTSPMVGTFYRAPAPGATPFVEVGQVIEEGQTVALLEAMKLMNPLAAEASGRVLEVCVKDGEPVEFGQLLLTLEPVS